MNKLHFRLILTIFPHFFLISLARGPHHPRGDVVVKRHVHYSPGKTAGKITEDTELLQDKEHIKEHLEDVIPQVDLSKMTEEELELYYFLLHDSDKNSKLDGLELLNAILHTTHGTTHSPENDLESHGGSKEEHEENDITDENNVDNTNFNHFVDLVDQVLKEDDKNQDGYLDYAEYVKGRKRTERVVDRKYSVELLK